MKACWSHRKELLIGERGYLLLVQGEFGDKVGSQKHQLYNLLPINLTTPKNNVKL